MKNPTNLSFFIKKIGFALFILIFFSCQQQKKESYNTIILSSDKHTKVTFLLTKKGQAAYTITYNDKIVTDTSLLGFELKEMPNLDKNFSIKNVINNTFDETWEPIWGETESIRNRYNEMKVFLTENNKEGRLLNIIFRVYDDGIGFRYEFPTQPNLTDFVITDENTQFKMSGDHNCWWIPADYDGYEYHYTTGKLSTLDASIYMKNAGWFNTIKDKYGANTPITLKSSDGLYLSIHEANLTNYPGMTLHVEDDKKTLSCDLVPAADGTKATLKTPFQTPWRTIHIAEEATDLMKSNLILNLNEPNKLTDVSWIKPMKYMGIWWGMHLGKTTWFQGPNHGATTKEAFRYMDFASKNGIEGLLVEGWNTGWAIWLDSIKRDGAFDFVTPYDDYDLKKIVEYGKARGVGLVMHHETSAAVSHYEEQADTAFQLLEDFGIHAIKSGYVGKIIPHGEYHHGQWMVNHLRRNILKAAEHKVMIVAHEPIKDTGLRRTYPNMMTREAVRGGEYNSPWGGGNPPEHTTIVPFTRMLSGPIDYTPGIFDLDYKRDEETHHRSSTLAKQLAFYVVLYSPIQMACDLPEHYEGHPAFQFIRDVPVDWADTKILNGEIGDYITIARKDKNSDDWYLGSITDEEARTLTVNLSFLDENKSYEATVYADSDESHHKDNPEAYNIQSKKVKKGDEFVIRMAEGGGQAVRFRLVE